MGKKHFARKKSEKKKNQQQQQKQTHGLFITLAN